MRNQIEEYKKVRRMRKLIEYAEVLIFLNCLRLFGEMEE